MASGIGFSFDPLNFVGGLLSMNNQNKLAERQENLQREFAQNSIQWRTADAKKAGIHPVVALGSQGISYNPSYVGGDNFGGSQASISYEPEKQVDEKTQAYNDKVNELNLRMQEANTREAEANATLAERSLLPKPQNDPLNVLLPNANSRGIGLPTSKTGMPGQASSIYGNKLGEAEQASRFSVNQDGTITIVPTQNLMDYVSESMLADIEWRLQNKYTDQVKYLNQALKGKLPEGYVVKSRLAPFGYEYGVVPKDEVFTFGEIFENYTLPGWLYKKYKSYKGGAK